MTVYFPANFPIPYAGAAFTVWAPRMLISAYPFLVGQFPISYWKNTFRLFKNTGRPMILDSGIYSFRASVLDRQDSDILTKDQIWRYINKYIEFIDTMGYGRTNHIIVEVDCDELCEDWKEVLAEQRELLGKKYGDRVLHCHHMSSGIKAWRQLVKDKKRVGLAYPEFKDRFPTEELATIIDVLDYARHDFNDKHVHIFGCTQPEFACFPDNFTCDSVSWSALVKWHRTMYINTPFEIKRVSDGRTYGSYSVPKSVKESVLPNMALYNKTYASFTKGKRMKNTTYGKLLASGLVASIQHWDWVRSRTKTLSKFKHTKDWNQL